MKKILLFCIIGCIMLVSVPFVAYAQYYCYTQTSGGVSWMVAEYSTQAGCEDPNECSWFCNVGASDCVRFCCLTQDNRDGEMNVCSGSPGGGGDSSLPDPLAGKSIEDIAKLIADILLTFSFVLGTIMIIISGYQYLTSAGNEERARKAKNTMFFAIVGILVVALVDVLIGVIRDVLQARNLGPPQ